MESRESNPTARTLDRNLEFQQNIKVLSFGAVVVRSRSNRIKDLSPHISDILSTGAFPWKRRR